MFSYFFSSFFFSFNYKFSVGFYQMAKIAVTPSIVLLEFVWFKKRVSVSKVNFGSYLNDVLLYNCFRSMQVMLNTTA